MEHRYGTRYPVEGIVTIAAPGIGEMPARLRDASISGMAVELADAPFCCNTVVDVEMTLPGDADLRIYRWQAMVIRRTETGMGLMFDRLRPPAITRLLASAADGLPLPARSTTWRAVPPRPTDKPPP